MVSDVIFAALGFVFVTLPYSLYRAVRYVIWRMLWLVSSKASAGVLTIFIVAWMMGELPGVSWQQFQNLVFYWFLVIIGTGLLEPIARLGPRRARRVKKLDPFFEVKICPPLQGSTGPSLSMEQRTALLPPHLRELITASLAAKAAHAGTGGGAAARLRVVKS